MRRIASRRASVICASFSSRAFCRIGGSVLSGSLPFSSSALSALSPRLLTAAARAAVASDASDMKESAPARTIRAPMLLVVLVLIRPVLALEGPVFLVIAHQTLKLEGGEQLSRVATVAQVLDLDLQLLLLADDGVDLREAGLPQKIAQPLVQIRQRLPGDEARGGDQVRAQLPRLGAQRQRRGGLFGERATGDVLQPRRPVRLVGQLTHALFHLRIAGGQRPQRLDVLHQAHRLRRVDPLGLPLLMRGQLVPDGDLVGDDACLAIERLNVAVELVEARIDLEQIGDRIVRRRDRRLAEQAPVERAALSGILEQRRHLHLDRAVDLNELVQRRAHRVELARLEVDHGVQQHHVGRQRRRWEVVVELFEKSARPLVLPLLKERPGRLEERVGQSIRIGGDAKVEVVGVVVLPLLVRDPAERQIGQVLDREVAAVDEEGEAVLVDLLDDLAEVVARRSEVILAGLDEPAEVEGGGVEARLAVDPREQRLGMAGVACLVGDLAGEVGVLGGAVARERLAAGLVIVIEHRQHLGLFFGLERDVDQRAVGRGELRGLWATREHAQQVALGALAAAGADERARQRQLGGGVVGRVLELDVALRLDDLVEADAGDLGVAGDQIILGGGQLVAQPLQRRRRLVAAEHPGLLEVRQIPRHRVARRLLRLRRWCGTGGLADEGDEERDHFSVFSSSSISGSYSGRSPLSSAVKATVVVLASGTWTTNVCSDSYPRSACSFSLFFPGRTSIFTVRVCAPGLIGRSDTLMSSSTSGFSPESQMALPSRRSSARWRMKSGAPFQRRVAPSLEA